MSIPPRILELRFSLIWTETFPSLLTDDAPQAPMAFLGKPDEYRVEYDKIKQRVIEIEERWSQELEQLHTLYKDDAKTLATKKAELNETFQKQVSDPALLTPPWPWFGRNYIHHFWQNYFENVEPDQLEGKKAWEYVVPLRITLPVRIGSPWPAEGPRWKVIGEGLFYPHGVAVVLMPRLLFRQQTDADDATTTKVELGLSPVRAMQRALQVRRDLTFPVTLPDGAQERLKLDALAIRLLNYLHERALGSGTPQGTRPSEPLTVATVIQGRGGDAMVPIMPQGELHKVLEGLCNWKDDWAQQQKLKPLAEANLLINNSTPGHMVYHLTRGRAVWMPTYFSSTSRRDQNKLSCYHRNLTLVTLQTEMLAQAVAFYTDYLDRGETSPSSVQSLARYAAIRLGYLYAALKKGSKRYTYNSASPRFYLEENGYVDSINQARKSFNNMAQLSYTPR